MKVIEPLLARAETLRVWSDDDSGTSAWEVRFSVGSFFLMISPEVYRGFPGEGQLLSQLASPPSDGVLAKVRANLKWQSQIDASALSDSLDLPQGEVESALAILGSRGLAGFDVSSGQYFHRELPFDLEQVERLQPRLKNARRLIEKGGVERIDDSGSTVVYRIPGTGTTHRVTLNDEQDRCTCPISANLF